MRYTGLAKSQLRVRKTIGSLKWLLIYGGECQVESKYHWVIQSTINECIELDLKLVKDKK